MKCLADKQDEQFLQNVISNLFIRSNQSRTKNTPSCKSQPQSDCIIPFKNRQVIQFSGLHIKQIKYVKSTNTNQYMDEIKLINLRNNKLQVFPQFVFDFKNLTSLFLKNNYLKNAPDLFHKVSQLKTLEINGRNLIETLPQSIGACKNLQNLNVKCDTFRIFPLAMQKLKLFTLVLQGKNIHKMTNLDKVTTKTIDLMEQDLVKIPQKLQLIKASKIIFDRNNIQQLPQSLQNFKHLKYFDITQRNIKVLPDCFKLMPQVKQINLQMNKIQELNIQFPSSLQIFNVKKNKINKFTLRVHSILNIKSLNLFQNQIQQLPNQIGELTTLVKLYLNSNRIKRLPKTIQKLANLEMLELQNNSIQELPFQIGCLISLVYFNFQENKITLIPPSIGKLTNLQLINGDRKQIESLPSQLFNCLKITSISFCSNQIPSIPSQIKYLKLLEKLEISHNLITFISIQIGEVTSLKIIDIQENQITYLPSSFGNLLKLQRLTFRMNKIQQIPSSIGNLINLIFLSGQLNQIKQIPPLIKISKIQSQLQQNCLNTQINWESNFVIRQLDLQKYLDQLISTQDQLMYIQKVIKQSNHRSSQVTVNNFKVQL